MVMLWMLSTLGASDRVPAGGSLMLLRGFVGDGVGTWGYQLEALSDAFTVIAWDCPGAGHSSAVPESFRLADYRWARSKARRNLERQSACMAGLSFGAVVALELFRRHVEVPQRLILASAYAGWAGSFRSDIVEERLRWSLEVSRLQRPSSSPRCCRACSLAPVDRVAAFAENVAEFDPAGFRLMAKASAEDDLRDVLAGIDIPTLLLYGGQDVRAPREVAEAIWAAIPRSRLIILPGVGHISSVEALDRFCAEVPAFLTER
jgi:pimeloyl-ACP methyl ester carboxylesterase